MVNIIESYRNILMYHEWPFFTALFIIGSLSVVGIGLATLLIAHFEYEYPKIMR
jgi:ABC-type polysaccharide/polyol phosphate export permease